MVSCLYCGEIIKGNELCCHSCGMQVAQDLMPLGVKTPKIARRIANKF